MNMFNRPFNQSRFHQSCSLSFNNLKQAQDWRPGVHFPRYFHTTHSVSNCSPDLFCLADVMTFHSMLLWWNCRRSESTTLVSMGGIFLCTKTSIVQISHSVVLIWFCKVFLLNRTLDCYKDKLSITTVIFIRSEKKLALLQLYVLPGTSRCMLWIKSMLRATCGNRGLTIVWNCLRETTYQIIKTSMFGHSPIQDSIGGFFCLGWN